MLVSVFFDDLPLYYKGAAIGAFEGEAFFNAEREIEEIHVHWWQIDATGTRTIGGVTYGLRVLVLTDYRDPIYIGIEASLLANYGPEIDEAMAELRLPAETDEHRLGCNQLI